VAVIEVNKRPSRRELAWFGAVPPIFFGLVGLLIWWQLDSVRGARISWGIGLGLAIAYFSVRPIRLPLYLGWMHAVKPIAWTISHLVLAAIFFLLITPIGMVMRLFGRDPLEREFGESVETYWVRHDPGGDTARYLRQS
jgi:hypothetical protein